MENERRPLFTAGRALEHAAADSRAVNRHSL